jgi:hypothetical protein
MDSDRRLRRVVGALAVVVVAAALAFSAWLSRDTAAPDAASLSLPADAEVRPADNAFSKLQSLVGALKELGLTGSARLRGLATYDTESQAEADQILGLEMVQRLPERIEDVLAAPAFQPTMESDAGDASDTWRGVLDITRLLRLRMQRQLFLGEREEAWQTAQLGWRFCQLLLLRTRRFHELSLAQASQSSWLKAVATAIDASQWSTTQLRALASLPEPAGTPDGLLRAVSSEYALFEHVAGQSAVAVEWPRRRLLIQPNRTKRAWLDAMAAPLAALRAGDLVRAHQAVTSADTSLEGGGMPTRNALGHRLVAASIAGMAAPIAQSVDAMAQLRLIRLRAAMALYHLEQGSWPARLDELRDRHLASMPLDPWSTQPQGFRYSVAERRIYSVGPDQRDDNGRFTDDFSHRGSSDDYGLRLPP